MSICHQIVVTLNLLIFRQLPLIVVIYQQYKYLVPIQVLYPPMITMYLLQQIPFNVHTIFTIVALFSIFFSSFCIFFLKPTLLQLFDFVVIVSRPLINNMHIMFCSKTRTPPELFYSTSVIKSAIDALLFSSNKGFKSPTQFICSYSFTTRSDLVWQMIQFIDILSIWIHTLDRWNLFLSLRTEKHSLEAVGVKI